MHLASDVSISGALVVFNATVDMSCVAVEGSVDEIVEDSESFALVLTAPDMPVLFLSDRLDLTISDNSTGEFYCVT